MLGRQKNGLVRMAWIICWKDVRLWFKQPLQILSTSVPPCLYLLIVWLGTSAMSHNPVALVVEDQGQAATQVAQMFVEANDFRVYRVNAATAQDLYHHLVVAAIITIPAGFSRQVTDHQRAALPVLIRNLNLDLTNDIRRAIPDTVVQYYQQNQNQSQATGTQADPTMLVSFAEHDLRAQDVQLFQYAVVPALVLLLLVNGLITGGLAAAREWERRTIKELLLSPATQSAVILGKVAAGWFATFALGLVVLGLGACAGWTRPVSLGAWLATVLMVALLALFAAGLGIAIGSWSRKIQPVTLSSTIFSVWLFSLSGGLGVLAFDPLWLQQVGAWIPVSYGIHALQMAVFYGSSDLLGRDVCVIAGSAVVAIVLGILAMRRDFAS